MKPSRTMKKIFRLLTVIVIVFIAGAECFAQANYTNSGPGQACGSASGTLTANNITLEEIAGWEEGFYDGNGQFQMQTFHPPSVPNPANIFNYSYTATTSNITKVFRVR